MEIRKILIDTSIIIDYMRSSQREKTQFVKLFKEFDLCISVITAFELYNGATSLSKTQDIETILNETECKFFNLETAKIASEIYRDLRGKNKFIEFRDILIAATALQNGLPIATLNKKHFERISNLEIYKSK